MANDDPGGLRGAETRLAAQLLRTGIGGRGAFDSAEAVAAEALERHRDREAAVRWIVNSHTRLAAVDGATVRGGSCRTRGAHNAAAASSAALSQITAAMP